jgi:ferredoxin--NADP+ reductase
MHISQGENPKKPGTPNTVRLYSIASTRYGDEFDGKTASLCVRRAVYWDPELGAEDPAKKGICSNFLCDSKPGDKVQITGQFFHISYHTITVLYWCLHHS